MELDLTMPAEYSRESLRTLAVHSMGLAEPLRTRPGKSAIFATISALGGIQIDALNVIRRSHELTLWSRLGCFDYSLVERMLYSPATKSPGTNKRRLFEYWLHGACIIPFDDFKYRLPLMSRFRSRGDAWQRRLTPEAIDMMLSEITKRGPTRPKEIAARTKRSSGWWDWSPTKLALEHLYNRGDLMVANRMNFERVYDTRERVVPDWVDQSIPSDDESLQWLLNRSLKALGVCRPAQIADYFQIKRTNAREAVQRLIDVGAFAVIHAHLGAGKVVEMVVHKDHLPTLERIAAGKITANRTTFLSPFDNIFWTKNRTDELWSFDQKLEAYKRKEDRRYGYFSMPILYRDQFVGRMDPYLDRNAKILHLRSLEIDTDRIEEMEHFLVEFAFAIDNFRVFHDALSIQIDLCKPRRMARTIQGALRD